jgi:hypothetical protein
MASVHDQATDIRRVGQTNNTRALLVRFSSDGCRHLLVAKVGKPCANARVRRYHAGSLRQGASS